jgi:hypothetical protein
MATLTPLKRLKRRPDSVTASVYSKTALAALKKKFVFRTTLDDLMVSTVIFDALEITLWWVNTRACTAFSWADDTVPATFSSIL